MLNIQNWNSVEAERNDFKRLTAGGHKCVVKNVEQRNSKSGKPMLVIAFDIAGGDFDGYYMDLYAKNVEKAQKDGMAEDEAKSGEQEVQKLLDNYSKKVEEVVAAKEKEIMTV